MMLFALLLSLFIPQDQPAEEASLSGTITDSVTGATLDKVQVLAESSDDSSTTG